MTDTTAPYTAAEVAFVKKMIADGLTLTRLVNERLVATVEAQATELADARAENRILIGAVESLNRKLKAADAVLTDLATCDIHYVNWDQMRKQASDTLDLLAVPGEVAQIRQARATGEPDG